MHNYSLKDPPRVRRPLSTEVKELIKEYSKAGTKAVHILRAIWTQFPDEKVTAKQVYNYRNFLRKAGFPILDDLAAMDVVGKVLEVAEQHKYIIFTECDEETQSSDLYGEDMHLSVIVTDREPGLMRPLDDVFPSSHHLLCTWHVYRDVERNVKRILNGNAHTAKSFAYNAFKAVIEAETRDVYEERMQFLEHNWSQFQAVLQYVRNTWLVVAHKFVRAWINTYLHFGNTTTCRVESAHKLLKEWLVIPNASFETVWHRVHMLLETQLTQIREKFQESRQKIGRQHNKYPFYQLRCNVQAIHGLGKVRRTAAVPVEARGRVPNHMSEIDFFQFSHKNKIPQVLHNHVQSYLDVEPDGNCGFRVFASCMLGGQNNHILCRQICYDEVINNPGLYGNIYGWDRWAESLERIRWTGTALAMANPSEVVQGSELEGDHVSREVGRTTRKGSRKEKSVVREPMVEFEKRLAKLELAVADHQDRWDEHPEVVAGVVEARMERFAGELQEVMQQMRDDMLGTLNEMVERCNKSKEESLARVAALQDDVNRLMGELETSRAESAHAVHAKAETRQGRLYMEASFANGSRWGMLDTGADTSYLTEEVANSLGVKWTPSKGRFKGVNGEWTGLVGEARDVPLKIGNWSGTASFSIAPMDDYGLVFGMEFLDQVKPIIVPSNDTMVILQGEKPCVVKFRRENEISPSQLNKGLKRGEHTFAAMVFEEEPCTEEPAKEERIPILKHSLSSLVPSSFFHFQPFLSFSLPPFFKVLPSFARFGGLKAELALDR
ncbi:OLC1v1036050C1 [Oldenlandia corymbosa var. corymbosa]|uniref:OLC1v1036050C1 n=1 Tax=Oldenlandia corymbosa var. corymbosa TaxID=529605 RepID=A0AAV1CUV8_OLDCO|nr:OLC1v1036050C1 [Oldenlandia corymbosa var. corymbosa]